MTEDEKSWLPLVETFVDGHWYDGKENPSSVIVTLESMGVPGVLLDYARALVQVQKGV
jgi:hypothetical protein